MRWWFLVLLFAAATVGCGGGGSTTPLQAPTLQPRVSVKFEVGVPSGLVTAGVESVVVAYVPVGEVVPPAVTPLTIDVATGSSDCATVAAKVECSGTIGVPLGQQNFTISLFSKTNGLGAQLGVKAFTSIISGAGQTVDISSANGTVQIVAALRLVISPNSIAAGTASNFTVSVNALDASGRPILSPYNVPVTIIAPPTVSPGLPPILNGPSPGPDGMVSLAATGPGQLFPFAYTGTSVGLPAAFVFSASAQGAQTVSAALSVSTPTPAPTPTPTATPTPAPTVGPFSTPSPGPIAVAPNVLLFEAPNQPAQSFVASEAGTTAFTAVSSNVAVATVSGAGSTFSVTPVGVGLALITVSDGAGRTGTVNAYVNSSTVIISGRRRHQ